MYRIPPFEDLRLALSGVLSAPSLGEAMKKSIANVCEFMDADYGLFVHRNQAGDFIHLESYGLTWIPEQEVLKNLEILLPGEKLSSINVEQMLAELWHHPAEEREFYERKESIRARIDPLGQDHFVLHSFFRESFSTCISAPPVCVGETSGEMTIGYSRDVKLPEWKRSLFNVMAVFASVAAKNVDRYDALRTKVEILRSVGEVLAATHDAMPSMLRLMLRQAIGSVAALGGCVTIFELSGKGNESDKARMIAGVGTYCEWLFENAPQKELKCDAAFVQRLRSGEIQKRTKGAESRLDIWDIDKANELELPPEVQRYLSDIETEVIIPFVHTDDVGRNRTAFLEVHGRHDSLFSDDNISVLRITAGVLDMLIRKFELESLGQQVLWEQSEKLMALRDLGANITKSGEFSKYKIGILEVMHRKLNSEISSIFLYDMNTRKLRLEEWFPHYPGLEAMAESYGRGRRDQGITGRLLTCSENDHVFFTSEETIEKYAIPEYLSKYESLPSWQARKNLARCPIAHYLAVPIVGERGKVFGALRVMNRVRGSSETNNQTLDDRAFRDPEDVDFLKTLAAIVSLALASERKARKLSILRQAAHEMLEKSSPKEVACSLARTVSDLMKYSACSVRLLAQDRLELIADLGFTSRQIDGVITPLAKSLVGRCLRHASPVIAKDILSTNPELNAGYEHVDFARVEHLRSACCVPVVDAQNHAIGVMTVYMRHEPYEFLEYEIEAFSLLAATCSIAMSNLHAAGDAKESRDRLHSLVKLLADLNEYVSLSSSKEEVVQLCFEGILSTLQCDGGLVFERIRPTHIQEDSSAAGVWKQMFSYHMGSGSVLPNQLIQALEKKSPQIFNWSDFDFGSDSATERYDFTTAFMLDFRGETLGLVVLFGKGNEAGRLSQEERISLSAVIGKQLAVALKNIESAQEKDKLTVALPAIVSAQLASGMVHEMNSKAHSGKIKLEAVIDAVQNVDVPKRALQDLVVAEDSFEAIGDLASKYLNFDRAIEPKLGIDATLQSINAVAEDALYSVEREMKSKNARIDIKGMDKVLKSKRFSFDGRFLKLAIRNLLLNALEWIPQNGRIAVSTGEKPNYIFVRIEDDGCGVDPGKEKEIFQPFFTTRDRGFGLGLYITRYIVETMHKGKLELTSPRNPTVFEIRLFLGSKGGSPDDALRTGSR